LLRPEIIAPSAANAMQMKEAAMTSAMKTLLVDEQNNWPKSY